MNKNTFGQIALIHHNSSQGGGWTLLHAASNKRIISLSAFCNREDAELLADLASVIDFSSCVDQIDPEVIAQFRTAYDMWVEDMKIRTGWIG